MYWEYVLDLPGISCNRDYYPSSVLGETDEKSIQNAFFDRIFVYF
jgi:hypothetical protein